MLIYPAGPDLIPFHPWSLAVSEQLIKDFLRKMAALGESSAAIGRVVSPCAGNRHGPRAVPI
ncbi:MAG TPA: hypothetical protein VFB30_07480, partial [Spirochaetia bacterium]|nr:hypothetical protein [Spirochaetia bacterium]